jgi:hypothetical protein
MTDPPFTPSAGTGLSRWLPRSNAKSRLSTEGRWISYRARLAGKTALDSPRRNETRESGLIHAPQVSIA